MIKTKLELKYFPALEQDLSNLLNEKLRLTNKRDIYRLILQIEPTVKNYKDLVIEFYKKNGIEKDGNIQLPNDIGADKLKELEELNNKEEELKISGLTFEDIESLTSSNSYYILMKVLLK